MLALLNFACQGKAIASHGIFSCKTRLLASARGLAVMVFRNLPVNIAHVVQREHRLGIDAQGAFQSGGAPSQVLPDCAYNTARLLYGSAISGNS